MRIEDKYFSPNGDGVKDSVRVEVIDDEGRDWELLLKSKGNTHKVWMGNGSSSIDWDGIGGGSDVLPEGKYEFVINTTEKRDRVRDREQVVLDVTPPIFQNSRVVKNTGTFQIRSNVIDKVAGIAPESLTLHIKDSLGQELLQINDVIWSENSSKFTAELSITQEQFEQLKTGGIQTVANIQDKVGNSIQAVLNFEDEIILQTFSQTPDGSLILKGKIQKDSESLIELSPNFGDDIEILSPPEISRNGNNFEILVSNYKFSENMIQEPEFGEPVSGKITVNSNVIGCDSTGQCLTSNSKEFKLPECSALDAPDSTSDIFSSCIPSASFAIQASPGAPGAQITTRHYIHGGGQNNKPMALGFQIRNSSKSKKVYGYWLVDSQGNWLKTLKRVVHDVTGAVYGPLIGVSWDGTNSKGQIVPEGTYYTVIRGMGQMERATKITVGCKGYYDHYPKILTAGKRSHILFRHDPNIYDSGWLQLLHNWVDGIYSSKNYLRNPVMNNYRWSNGDKGKGSLYPDTWSSSKIETNVISVANFNSLTDTCEKQNDGRYRLHGNRDGQKLRVAVEKINNNIITGFPLTGEQPENYYTRPDILLNLIGRN